MTTQELAGHFDHTLLKPTATEKEIIVLCSEAKDWNFASVCVNPTWVAVASKELRNTSVKVCTVIGFPLGANTSEIKAEEARYAVEQGAQEVDMVINIGLALTGDWEKVEKDIEAVVKASKDQIVKVILETCFLDEDQIVKACKAAEKAGANFVKTSTGFGTGGATKENVALMRKTVSKTLSVKASGGIRTLKDSLTMIDAGADRIGASASVAIMKEFQGENHAGISSGY